MEAVLTTKERKKLQRRILNLFEGDADTQWKKPMLERELGAGWEDIRAAINVLDKKGKLRLKRIHPSRLWNARYRKELGL